LKACDHGSVLWARTHESIGKTIEGARDKLDIRIDDVRKELGGQIQIVGRDVGDVRERLARIEGAATARGTEAPQVIPPQEPIAGHA
jgi:hypothetical protein